MNIEAKARPVKHRAKNGTNRWPTQRISLFRTNNLPPDTFFQGAQLLWHGICRSCQIGKRLWCNLAVGGSYPSCSLDCYCRHEVKHANESQVAQPEHRAEDSSNRFEPAR
jgi:hypothetical protein